MQDSENRKFYYTIIQSTTVPYGMACEQQNLAVKYDFKTNFHFSLMKKTNLKTKFHFYLTKLGDHF